MKTDAGRKFCNRCSHRNNGKLIPVSLLSAAQLIYGFRLDGADRNVACAMCGKSLNAAAEKSSKKQPVIEGRKSTSK